MSKSKVTLTGGLVNIWAVDLRFLLVDHRSALHLARQTLLGLLDQLSRILHLNPRLRFLNHRLNLRLTFLIRRTFSLFVVTAAVLFLVHRHGRVSNERVAAVRPGTVKMPINAITVATNQPAVDHLVEERKTRWYVDVIVKVFAVHQQLIGPVGGEVTPKLRAMMVSRRPEGASRIWTPIGIVRGETFRFAKAVRRRDTALPLFGHRIGCQARRLRFR